MKKILITGATSGIAEELIKQIKNDYYIYVTTHTNSELKRMKHNYQNNHNIECFKLDITDKIDRNKLYNLDVDILICNAAISIGGSIINMNVDDIRHNYEVNVFSNIEIIQIILKNMIKKNRGKIVIMGSLASIIPIANIGSYSSTKAALVKISECLKRELKILNTNIKISLIEPGLYHTGFNNLMFDNKYDTEFDDLFKEELELIRKKEKIILFFERRDLNSIVRQIKKSLESDKFIYRAPFTQSFIAKIYSLFFE